MSTNRRLFVAAAVGASLFASQPATAQVAKSGYTLPLGLALEAVAEAVRTCEANGFNVSAAVVDSSGVQKAFAKGDHSTIHTKDTSFGKAYTVVTMGPIFQFETTSAFVTNFLAKNPGSTALVSIPGILPLAGGVAIKAKGEIVAAIGVGGAPGGDKDEICAMAGLAKIKDKLPQ